MRLGWTRWLVIGALAMVVLVVGGTWVYINVIEGDAPTRLTVDDATTAASDSSAVDAGADPSGAWNVGDGSTAGYRVNEVLFGQSSEAVGRTTDITGSMTVDGTTVTDATFKVDMTTVTSDQSRRDVQFNGRIMETGTYPTATLELTEPIELGTIPAEGEEVTFSATGDLTLHGVTESVTFDVTGQWTGATVQIAGSIPVTFADYGIDDPSFAGVISTEDHGTLEFALDLEH